jgi:hypothetical protein
MRNCLCCGPTRRTNPHIAVCVGVCVLACVYMCLLVCVITHVCTIWACGCVDVWVGGWYVGLLMCV